MKLLQRHGILTHLNSSLYHSHSNGKAEAAVKIAKSLLRKDDGDTFLAMLNWQNTPTESNEYSPSQKLHSTNFTTYHSNITVMDK